MCLNSFFNIGCSDIANVKMISKTGAGYTVSITWQYQAVSIRI
jgi:hypothetical protein